MKNFTVYPRLFALLALSFVLATIVGTVSHELGHYAVSKCYGFSPKLHYASVSFDGAPYKYEVFDSLYKADESKILAKKSSPEKEYFLHYRSELGKTIGIRDLIIRMSGPLQTMITGSLGVLWLWYYRKKIRTETELSVKQWFGVLIAFFWSRQLAILLQKIVNYVMCRNSRGDEERIAYHLQVNQWILITLWGIIGAAILSWVVFYIIPKQQRFTFIMAGLAGSTLGFVVWMLWLGPALLP